MFSDQFIGWRKATRSGGVSGGCVEVGRAENARGLRDTKLAPNSPIISLSDGTFNALVDALRSGRLHG